ncbi:MAG: sigma-54-dependent Fis family transcriptional regulator, partial [Gemmatimonadetes bacterium]|nr:sigma-54-dependent Fis family transcriptional regulator [Gemmatimonadota bacterium]
LGSSTLDRDPSEDTDQSLEAMEAVHVQKVLREVGGVKRQAAEVLKISRTRLDRIIEKHGLEVPE